MWSGRKALIGRRDRVAKIIGQEGRFDGLSQMIGQVFDEAAFKAQAKANGWHDPRIEKEETAPLRRNDLYAGRLTAVVSDQNKVTRFLVG